MADQNQTSSLLSTFDPDELVYWQQMNTMTTVLDLLPRTPPGVTKATLVTLLEGQYADAYWEAWDHSRRFSRSGHEDIIEYVVTVLEDAGFLVRGSGLYRADPIPDQMPTSCSWSPSFWRDFQDMYVRCRRFLDQQGMSLMSELDKEGLVQQVLQKEADERRALKLPEVN